MLVLLVLLGARGQCAASEVHLFVRTVVSESLGHWAFVFWKACFTRSNDGYSARKVVVMVRYVSNNGGDTGSDEKTVCSLPVALRRTDCTSAMGSTTTSSTERIESPEEDAGCTVL